MPFQLRPQETAFWPQPFIETEVHLLVVTNQRVVQFSDEGKKEMETREISFVGRVSERPWLIAGVVALLVGLPALVTGAWLFFSAGPLQVPAVPGVPPIPPVPGIPPIPGAAPAAPAQNPGDDPAAEEPTEDGAPPPVATASGPADPKKQRIFGVGLVVLGFLLGAGGVLAASRQRHVVLVRGGPKVITIRTADKMEQTQLLSTLNAVQSAGKLAPQPAAAPKPKAAPVDDGGDPVKALQELGAKRAAGKITDEEFVAKREILLERLKNRK